MDELCVICAEPIDYCQGHPGNWNRVIEVIHDMVDEQTIERVKDHIISGRCRWYWDPEVEGIAGLLDLGTNHARMVVYLEGGGPFEDNRDDFELGDDFWEEANDDE